MSTKERLKKLKLPDPLVTKGGKRVRTRDEFWARREEIKRLLSDEIYGKIPAPPDHLEVTVSSVDRSFAAGKAPKYELSFEATFGTESVKFNVTSAVPNTDGTPPTVIYISDSENIPNRFLPIEEITDRGYAVFTVYFENITPLGDGKHFSDGFARYLSPGRRSATSTGKLAMWAWAAMRVMDYVTKQGCIDKGNVAVAGHGIFGISALIAGGFDERFKYVIANCAGLLGSSLSRGKRGDSPESLTEKAPELFCKRFINNQAPFESRKYDQNFLLFLSLDRHLLIGCAECDLVGDPQNEFLALASLADTISIINGECTLLERPMPQAGEIITDGRICYHLRHGRRYFSRDDWNIYLDYIDKNL